VHVYQNYQDLYDTAELLRKRLYKCSVPVADPAVAFNGFVVFFFVFGMMVERQKERQGHNWKCSYIYIT
jgi:hypothetical protein